MTDRELMQQALEALEEGLTSKQWRELITALRERLAQPWETYCDTHCTAFDHHPNCKLAQPEQELVATLIKRGSTHTYMSERVSKLPDGTYSLYTAPQPAQQPVQEPYGWKVYGVNSLFIGEFAEADARAEAKRIGGTCIAFPLYTTPQPRQWQGLTDKEFDEIYQHYPAKAAAMERVEVVLREKNQKENPGVL